MYSFNLEYHHSNGYKSSMIGGQSTLEKAREELAKGIQYYSTECPVAIDTAEIVKVCPSCNGRGEHVKTWKKTGIITKRTPCRACNGQGSTLLEKWIV